MRKHTTVKPLTTQQREEVARVAKSLGLDGDPDAIIGQALSAGVLRGEVSKEISAITNAAGIVWLAPAVWMQLTKENTLTAESAREILRTASSMDIFKGPIPGDDKMALAEVKALIALAQQAWDSGVHNTQTQTILGMAKRAENGEVQIIEETQEAVVEQPPVEQQDVEIEEVEKVPESASEADEDEKQEPEYPEEVQRALDILKQEAENTPEAKRTRKTRIAASSVHRRKASKKSVPLPYDGYDEGRLSDIKFRIGAAVKKYRLDYDVKALDAFLKSIISYENSLLRPRKSILNYVEEVRKIHVKGKEPTKRNETKPDSPRKEVQGSTPESPGEEAQHEEVPEGKASGERRPESPAPSEIDADGESAVEGRQEDREAPSEGEQESVASTGVRNEIIAEEVEEQIGLVAAGVQQEYKSKRLHVPELPQEKPSRLPFDLTTLDDAQLRKAHNDYAAYAYRVGYLLGLEEVSLTAAKEEYEREHARQLVVIDKQDFNGRAKLASVIEAEIEQNESIQVLARKRNYHAMRVASLKGERDQYSRMADVVSRQATMRSDEWQKHK